MSKSCGLFGGGTYLASCFHFGREHYFFFFYITTSLTFPYYSQNHFSQLLTFKICLLANTATIPKPNFIYILTFQMLSLQDKNFLEFNLTLKNARHKVGSLAFNGISTIVGYLMSNPIYVCEVRTFGLMACQPLVI